MSPEILTRALLAALIIAGGLAFYWLASRLALTRAQKNRSSDTSTLPGLRPGVPAVLFFTTPDCAACKTIQRPALQRVQDRLGNRLQVIEVDAQAQPDLASRWGVLSVPSTFILDQHGHLRHANHGAARTEKLIRQINSA